jgi:hypothetical protein
MSLVLSGAITVPKANVTFLVDIFCLLEKAIKRHIDSGNFAET